MKAQAQAPRRSVYLHCKGVFTGANARVRKTKSVRKVLEKNKHSFGALTNKYNLGTICNVAKELWQPPRWRQLNDVSKPICRIYPEKEMSIQNARRFNEDLARLYSFIFTGTLNEITVNYKLYRIHVKCGVLLEISISSHMSASTLS